MHPLPSVVDRPSARCNIGREEIDRRRRTAIALTAATVVVAGALLVAHGPSRLLIWPVATAAAVTWLQVLQRFCVAFGAAGLENFGPLGDERAVDPGIRRADLRRALQLVVEGALIGLVVALGLSAIPV